MRPDDYVSTLLRTEQHDEFDGIRSSCVPLTATEMSRPDAPSAPGQTQASSPCTALRPTSSWVVCLNVGRGRPPWGQQ